MRQQDWKMCFCYGGNSSGHCYKDARREGRGCSLGGRRGDTRSEKGGRSLSPHLILPLLPFVFSSRFLLPLPCLQTSTSPSFLSHACLQVVFNGQLTMSRGQRRKRKYFPVGAISHWRGARSWPRAHILSPACAPSVHRNGHFQQKWSSKTIYWL